MRLLGIPFEGCIFAEPTLGAPDSDVGPHGVRAAILDWAPEADHSTVAVTAAVKLRYRERLGGRRRIHSFTACAVTPTVPNLRQLTDPAEFHRPR